MGVQYSFREIAHCIFYLHGCPFWLGEDANAGGWAKSQTIHPPTSQSDTRVHIRLRQYHLKRVTVLDFREEDKISTFKKDIQLHMESNYSDDKDFLKTILSHPCHYSPGSVNLGRRISEPAFQPCSFLHLRQAFALTYLCQSDPRVSVR